MAKSLQEQLLGAGLVDKKKAKAIKQEQRKTKKQKGRVGLESEANEKKQRLDQERQAKAERDRELNAERNEELKEREIIAQVKQLISVNKLSVDGELGYQFADGSKIQKLYVDEASQTALAKGRLSIVRDAQSYAVIASQVAEKIKQRKPEFVVVLNEKASQEVDEDDPYKDYQIPDDLMW